MSNPTTGQTVPCKPCSARLSVLAVVGALISAYLVYHHVEVRGNFSTGPSLCDFGGVMNCEEVARSAFAEFLGIPVASWALFYYLGLLLFFPLTKPTGASAPMAERLRADSALALTTLALAPTLLLAVVSAVLIGYVCLFCSLLYVVNAAMFLVALTDKTRTKGFQASLKAGFAALPAFGLKRGSLAPALIGVALISAFAPVALERYWFQPRHVEISKESNLRPVIDELNKAPVAGGLFTDEGTLEEKDFSHGARNAKITIVEFSDFECPYCKRASGVLRSLLEEFPEVRLVFKNFPLDHACNSSIPEGHGHKFACQAAELARCAGLQSEEAFWKTHDAIFGLPELSAEAIDELPAKLGLDQAAIKTCRTEGTGLRRVAKDIARGIELDLPGTPTMYFNGRRMDFPQLEILPGVVRILLREKKITQ